MYLTGIVNIDPSHLTEIRRKPTKGFRRFAEILTSGLLSEKEEHETFSAISILQEVNVTMRSLGITDVVRFTKDDQVLYDDSDGTNTDDMDAVFTELNQQRGSSHATVFNTLSLLLEHHLPDITLVIDVRVKRVHTIGIYPIQIVVNGLATEFQADGETPLEDRMEETFADSTAYEEFETKMREQFDGFMTQLEYAVRSKMKITDVNHSTLLNVVRPRGESKTSPGADPTWTGADAGSSSQDPVFQRYNSDSNAFAYCWLWSSMMHNHGTHVHDATIVDEAGQPLMVVDSQGFSAAETSALDPEVPFSETDYNDFDASSWNTGDMGGDDSSTKWFSGGDDVGGSSWLDSFSFGGDSGGDGGGSSCGSSCGGGCGGGGD